MRILQNEMMDQKSSPLLCESLNIPPPMDHILSKSIVPWQEEYFGFYTLCFFQSFCDKKLLILTTDTTVWNGCRWGKPQNYSECLQPCPLILHIAFFWTSNVRAEANWSSLYLIHGCLIHTQNFVVRRALAGHSYDDSLMACNDGQSSGYLMGGEDLMPLTQLCLTGVGMLSNTKGWKYSAIFLISLCWG